MAEPFVYFRTRNELDFWACQSPCDKHQEAQCNYDINHPIRIHRCGICLQDFFPGLQKSKQALSGKAAFHSTAYPEFLLPPVKDGESDFDDGI